MTDIEKNVQIAVPIERVWAALTDPYAMGEWMEDDTVQIDLQPAGRYTVFGGETTGVFTLIEKPDFLEYTWRQNTWDRSWPDSVVRWELRRMGKTTQIHLIHSKFPNAEERTNHDESWDLYWLEPMAEWLESEM
ncbi:MAG: SRPBCC domain-containing protein [Chloroflexota bacterium]